MVSNPKRIHPVERDSYLYSGVPVDSGCLQLTHPGAGPDSTACQALFDAGMRMAQGRGARDRGLWLLLGRESRERGWSALRRNGTVLQIEAPGAETVGALMWKRVFDVVAAAALLLLLAPLLLCLALLVRLDSPGPAFFSQTRIGEGGRRFTLWKFRSMVRDAHRYARSPVVPDDERLTRLGRLLRRTSLDELPQLLNVLRGDMSLVGPRPEMPFIVEGYTAFERGRLAARPGMTGLWQVSPGRIAPIHEHVEYDLHYIRHRSLALDLAILIRTVGVVLRGDGGI